MLPAVRTDEEWQAVVFDESLVRTAAEDLAARLGLAGTRRRRYPDGSRPVCAAGDNRVLKLWPDASAAGSDLGRARPRRTSGHMGLCAGRRPS